MALKKFKKLFVADDEEDINDNGEDDFYSVSKEDALKDADKTGNKMILLEPRAYSESQQIANYLKSNNAVIVNLKRVTPDQAKRIVDFLSGTLYAIEGGLEKLGGGIFLCTPKDVPVEGKITDDNPVKGKEKKPREEGRNEDEIDWE